MKRFKLTIEIEADDVLDIEAKLRDIQFELVTDKLSAKSIFAGGGCTGVVTWQEHR